MSKKILRKRLETSLTKLITDTLTKKDVTAAAKTKKTISDASKQIAKKFYKSLKPASAKTSSKAAPKASAPKKAAVKGKTNRKK